MLEELKKRVFNANLSLVKCNLVVLTWGNVSGVDLKKKLVVIKPSGVDYNKMTAEDMVVIDFDGNVVEGNHRPSSDTPTHLYLYRKYPQIGGVVHTHSTYATAFAQAGKCITAYGTTHADAFYGDIPCTRDLTFEEIKSEYELNTGVVIGESINNDDILAIPCVLVKNHGVFTWGATPEGAVVSAVTVEEVAKMASVTHIINSNTPRINQHLLDKHYFRKHGENAYYGQK